MCESNISMWLVDTSTKINKISVNDYFDNPLINRNRSSKYEYDLGTDTNLQKYLSEKSITEMVKINSEIGRILNKFKISIKINMKILDNLVKNHLPETRKIALGIAKMLPNELQKSVNLKALKEATCLHDIAKVIIPENIVNKAGKLTDSEREIMKEHSILSYEMLKNTDLDKETLNLIKNHHKNPQNLKGANSEISDINLQILSISDVYSALREKRCYKAELSKEKALNIIKQDVERGKFHPLVYKALVEYTNVADGLSGANPQRKIFNLKPIHGFGA